MSKDATPQSHNLLNFDRAKMREYFAAIGEKSFRADQVLKWIHQHGLKNFDQMTNLSKKLRAYLNANAVILLPKIIKQQKSIDGTLISRHLSRKNNSPINHFSDL